MLANGTAHTTLWYDDNKHCVVIIDQTQLPHRFNTLRLTSLDDFCHAITAMQVRGAPLIGVTAAFGFALALAEGATPEQQRYVADTLLATRPTAVNLRWAIERIQRSIKNTAPELCAERALQEAILIRKQDIDTCESIGRHGLDLIRSIQHQKQGQTLNILTHCNAGWLATIDWGTALAPIYKAMQAGINVHVWVDETRPRNQGASLTAWELEQQGIAHTLIADNTGGHLMQKGMVDLCLVGSDRTTASGDVCNKIGTYLKALAADDNQVPFYVALPASTIDWNIDNGLEDIPIEQRDPRELTHISGLADNGEITEVQLVANSPAANYAFDVTPAKLIGGLITEHGIYQANKNSLATLEQQLQLN